jgi:TonB family protein
MTTFSQRAYLLIVTGITTFIPVLVPAQTPPSSLVTDSHSPVGRWVAEHPSKGGIGSWWEFRADGTLTMYFGVTVDNHIDRSGDTFMTPSGVAGGERVRAKYTIANNVLSIDTGASSPATYSRIGTAPNASDPLIGSWRPLPSPAYAGDDPNMAIMQKVMTTKGMLVFTPDSMEYLRVPLGTREGSWDDQSHTFRIRDDSVAYSFDRKDSKLLLGQPPNGKEVDSYLPDPLSPTAIAAQPSRQTGQRNETPDANGVFHQGPGIVMPKIIHFVEASFTDEARKRKIGGTVNIQVVVGADGNPLTPHVFKSAASAYTDPADRAAAQTLDQKAIEAVSQYQFTPGTLQGKAVPIMVTVEVNFQLH